MDEEVWKDISGYEGLYQVSDRGRVRGLSREVVSRTKDGAPYTRRLPATPALRPGRASNGYLTVALNKEGKARSYCVHALVAAAFIGPRPEGLQVLHGPLGPGVNTVGNLRYGTQSENMKDIILHGGRKLTVETVARIRDRIQTAPSYAHVAREFGIHRTQVRDIKRGRQYGNV